MSANHLDPNAARGRQGRRPSTDKSAGYERTEKFVPSSNDRAKNPRKLVLCFDGTGNKFHGDDSDSNILKIFRMLNREADDQYHYYQRKD